MKQYKKFKNGQHGWDMGSYFEVRSTKVWDGEPIYKCEFVPEKGRPWVEYLSHRYMHEHKCMHFSKDGKYIGAV